MNPAVMMLVNPLVMIPPDVEETSMLDPFSTRIPDSFLSGSSLPLLHHLLAPSRINTPMANNHIRLLLGMWLELASARSSGLGECDQSIHEATRSAYVDILDGLAISVANTRYGKVSDDLVKGSNLVSKDVGID